MLSVIELAIEKLKRESPSHPNRLDDPEWDKMDRRPVHDWRAHINSDVAERWNELSLEARAVAFLTAVEAAHDERWPT